MQRVSLFAALCGCGFDTEALSGTGPDEEDFQDYRDVVDPCDSGWSLGFGADFEDPDENLRDRWELPMSLIWHVDAGNLVAEMPESGSDYWTTHIVASDLLARDVWMRADVRAVRDQWPLLQARVDPEAGDERFYGLRLMGDLGGIEIFLQEQPENVDCSVSPTCEAVYFEAPLAEDAFYRIVLTVRTDAGAARVTGGVWALDAEGRPGPDPIGDGSRTYADDEALDFDGGFGLSGWQGQIRFDNVFVFTCP